MLVSAGIGLTPTVAMLRALHGSGAGRPVNVLDVDRYAADLPLWPEVESLVGQLPAARIRLFLTRASPAVCEQLGAVSGRPGDDDVYEVVENGENSAAFVYGPVGFLTEDAGVPGGRRDRGR